MASQTPQLLAEIRDAIRHASESRHHDAEKLLKELKELHEVFLNTDRKRRRPATPTRIRRSR